LTLHPPEPPPQADTNPLADEASAAKRSKLDLSPPATPPKRPAPEVRSCNVNTYVIQTVKVPKYHFCLVKCCGTYYLCAATDHHLMLENNVEGSS